MNEPGPVNNHTFDIVTFDQGMLPSWESSSIEQVCERLKIDEDEITKLVEDDKKLMKEIITQTQLILNHREILRESKKKNYKIYKEE
jgi:predicted component of type VI protein secretion system